MPLRFEGGILGMQSHSDITYNGLCVVQLFTFSEKETVY